MQMLASANRANNTNGSSQVSAAPSSFASLLSPSYGAASQQEFQCQAPSSAPHNCTTGGRQDMYMNEMWDFDPTEYRFADIQGLWIRKDTLDILLRVVFVAPIVLLGIVGNLTIIYSMCKFKPFRSKPTNIFILNMAIADLLTTMVCPTAALFTDIYQFYVLGAFICRFEGFVKITCLLVSSYSLIVLSTDWLLCVVQPCRTRITIKQSWLALATIWILSVLMASPLFVWRKLRQRIWKDLVEVWCCELIQYTKYYWVVITFFLIYLPTFFMTIVLVVILAQMDRFEARLRRSRSIQTGPNCSLSINMKYRRRIVKILFTYLLTSIICWTPLQFTIIYRHFRSDPVPSPWFFELAFYSQLSASLTAAMNPIIFGFLSQPFRRVVAKSLMFKFLDKIVGSNAGARSSAENNHQRNEVHAMNNTARHHHERPVVNGAGQGPQLISGQNQSSRQLHKVQPYESHHQSTKRLGSDREIFVSTLANQPTTSQGSRARPSSCKASAAVVSGSTPVQEQSQLGSSKRVSFNRHVDSRVGRVNGAFEDCTNPPTHRRQQQKSQPEPVVHRSMQETPVGADQFPNRTTSFMRPVSTVSMDSINIEENLAENDMNDAGDGE